MKNFFKKEKLINFFFLMLFCVIYILIFIFLCLKFDIITVPLYLISSTLFLGLFISFFSNKLSLSFILKMYSSIYIINILFFLFFIYLFLDDRNAIYIKIYDLICYEDFVISFDIYFNTVTIIMFSVVLIVSCFVSLFSIWYMYGDPNFSKFLSLITFFSFFMIILVCSNNLIMIFVGWEGIGLFSYLLINFWNTRTTANRSALKAIVINKIGDCFLYLFMFLYWFSYKTFNIYEPLTLLKISRFDVQFLNLNINTVIILCVVVAAMAKSAQIILHTWLPDAMEGPTPVSALLHAATMVTAGVFILLKFNFILDNDYSISWYIIYVGLFTNLLASFTAIKQNDIKKIIAYSTASQIGLIFMAVGMHISNVSLFHIFNHAFFKAFLFMLAGYIIHLSQNKQDLRSISIKNNNTYIIYSCLLVCCFSLASIPFFSGYYSKELMLNISYLYSKEAGYLTFYFLNLSAITTTIYTIKIMFYLFKYNIKPLLNKKIAEKFQSEKGATAIILYCIFLLSILLCILSGFIFFYFFNDSFIYFTNEISIHLESEKSINYVMFETSLIVLLFYIFYAFIIYITSEILKIHERYISGGSIKEMSFRKFFYNDMYYYIAAVAVPINYILLFFLDKQFIEKKISLIKVYIKSKSNYWTKIKIFSHLLVLVEVIIFSHFFPIGIIDYITFYVIYYGIITSEFHKKYIGNEWEK